MAGPIQDEEHALRGAQLPTPPRSPVLHPHLPTDDHVSGSSEHSTFLSFPLELRYMIYRHLNKTAVINKRNSAIQVVLFDAPGLPLQLVSQQIQDEYIDCKKRSIRMAISLDTLKTSRSINDTAAIFCVGFPLGLLPTIRHIEIRITWDRLVELSNVGKKIEPWLKRYTDAQLEFQARMTWTPSKGICAGINDIMSRIGTWCAENAQVVIYLNLGSACFYQGRYAYVFHEPTLSALQRDTAKSWPKPGNLTIRYFMLTPVCGDFEREAALEHFGTTLLWGMIPTTGPGGLGGFLPRFLCQANWTKEYRVEKLNGRVQSMERRTKTLERNIEEQMTRVGVLRTCQRVLVTLIESLQSRITNLEEHTGSREENIKSLEQDIKSCKDDIESWEENFEMARKDMLRLRLRIGSLNSDIAWLSKHPDGQGNILGSLGYSASI